MEHAVVGFAASKVTELPTNATKKRIPDADPGEYLDYFMYDDDGTAEYKVEAKKRVDEMLKRERYVRAKLSSAFPRALGAVPERMAAAHVKENAHKTYRELFVLVEEFCLLLIAIGWWSASTEEIDPEQLARCRAVYLEGMQHKMTLISSDSMRPLIDHATEEFGLIAF